MNVRNEDPNAADLEFTPETLREYAKETETLREHALFDVDSAGADPEAEQFFLMALSHLENAHRSFELAALKQSRALAGGLSRTLAGGR
jgi:hypothetical protein